MTLKVRVEGMPWPKTSPTHYHAQLRLPEKGHAALGLVVHRANGRFTPQSQDAEMTEGAV